MGKFDKGFAFLGILYEVAQTLHTKTHVSLHPRSVQRALEHMRNLTKGRLQANLGEKEPGKSLSERAVYTL